MCWWADRGLLGVGTHVACSERSGTRSCYEQHRCAILFVYANHQQLCHAVSILCSRHGLTGTPFTGGSARPQVEVAVVQQEQPGTSSEPPPPPPGVVVGADAEENKSRTGSSGISSGLRLEGVGFHLRMICRACLYGITDARHGRYPSILRAGDAKRSPCHDATLRSSASRRNDVCMSYSSGAVYCMHGAWGYKQLAT